MISMILQLVAFSNGFPIESLKTQEELDLADDILVAKICEEDINVAMKVVILAGGFGTRLSEETQNKPKPMVKIGEKPILQHIMSLYSFFGFCEFVIALGYMSESIKEYFLNIYPLSNNLSIDLQSGKTTIHNRKLPNWKIDLVDTGLETQTGGRSHKIC